jgi:hypothetical protein
MASTTQEQARISPISINLFDHVPRGVTGVTGRIAYKKKVLPELSSLRVIRTSLFGEWGAMQHSEQFTDLYPIDGGTACNRLARSLSAHQVNPSPKISAAGLPLPCP